MKDKSNFEVSSNQYNGKIIYKWIIRNLPPLSWNILAVRIGEKFLKNGVDPFDISDKTTFDLELVKEINSFVKNNYDKEIPLR